MPDDYRRLTIRDLKRKKLVLEIALLQKQTVEEPPRRLNVLERMAKYLERNIGQIVTIGGLIAAVITPVWSYVSSQRQAKLVQVNSHILSIMLSGKKLTDEGLMTISTQDPEAVAPVLLDQLNRGKISPEDATEIFKRMYEVNKDLARYSVWDKILFAFVPDNQHMLEHELYLNAKRQLGKKYSNEAAKVSETYVNIILDLDLENKKAFRELMDLVTQKCGKDSAYQHLCDYRDERLKEKAQK